MVLLHRSVLVYDLSFTFLCRRVLCFAALSQSMGLRTEELEDELEVQEMEDMQARIHSLRDDGDGSDDVEPDPNPEPEPESEPPRTDEL